MGGDEGTGEMFRENKNPSTKAVSGCQFSKITARLNKTRDQK